MFGNDKKVDRGQFVRMGKFWLQEVALLRAMLHGSIAGNRQQTETLQGAEAW